MKIKALLIILIIPTVVLFSQSKDSINFAIPDSLLIKQNFDYNTQFNNSNLEEKFSLQTELQTQRLLKTLFLAGFIFMTLIVIFLIYINNFKIKQILSMIKNQESLLDMKTFETEKMSIILNNTVDGIAIIDSQNNILWCNKSFNEIFSLDENDLKGKPIDFFTSKDQSIQELLNKAKNEQKPIQFAFTYLNKKGVDLFLQRRIIPISDKEGKNINYAIIDTDFTALKIATGN